MLKKKVLFYTQVYFFDNALEYAKMLTDNSFEVHFLINISTNQLKANILNLDIDLSSFMGLRTLKSVQNEWKLDYIASYLENCASVNFAIFPSKGIFPTTKVSRAIKRHIKKINPDFIHLDEVSNRHLFLFDYLLQKKRKIIVNIHDPKLHSGESDKHRIWTRKLLFKFVSKFVVFSEYSRALLEPQLNFKKEIHVLKLLPYTVYSKFLPSPVNHISRNVISFVGRISPYKGVELFVDAIDIVNEKFSNEKFIIGGKTIPNYRPDFLDSKVQQLEIRNKFLSNGEMAELISSSKLIICPYVDATQSGIIMAAYALSCPVLVTDTGGLPEYVTLNSSGLIAKDQTAESIAESICEFLEHNKGKEMVKFLSENKLGKKYKDENLEKVLKLYK